MAEAGFVSVIIPTHQRRELLRRALDSLARQSMAADRYEVIVAIDRSDDGTREMLASLATRYRLDVVESVHPGRAAACNAGLARAGGEVLIILDDDMQVIPELIERHRLHHPSGSRLCVIGAAPVELNGSSPLAARYVQAKFAAHLAKLSEPGHEFVPRDFYSGNASIRAEVLREVGGFDESFTMYGNEDVDLYLRLRAVGVTVRFDPEACAGQEYDKDLRALGRDTIAKGRTVVSLARTHPEIFQSLRLASPRENSRAWLSARAGLLAATRRSARVADAVLAVAALMERLGFWRWPLFYRPVLDYAFWTGVDSELGRPSDGWDLVKLGMQLRRGPIDLLLHG